MHIAFIAYGKRSEVELLFRDMEAQKHRLIYTKEDKKMQVWIQGQLRVLPAGIYEYVCPREDMEPVLATLINEENLNERYVSNAKLSILRKIFRLKKVPEFNKEKKLLWITEHVVIIPIGIREDRDLIDDVGSTKGWTHEAI